MAAWYDGISFTVEVSFSTDPLATPSWTDITEYVRRIPSIRRGRSSEYSEISPSSAEIVLDNRDNRFDPDNGSSPYSPNLQPMKRLKITWAVGASSGLLFLGFVTGWPQEEEQNADATTTIRCVDGTRFIKNEPLSGSAYEQVVLDDSPTYYWPLQESFSDLVEGRRSWLGEIRPSGAFGDAEDPDGFTPGQKLPRGGDSAIALEAGSSSAPLGLVASLPDETPDWSPKTVEFWANFPKLPTSGAVNPILAIWSPEAFWTLTVDSGESSGHQAILQYHNFNNDVKYVGIYTFGLHELRTGMRHVVLVTDSSTDVRVYIDGVKKFTSDALASPATSAFDNQPGRFSFEFDEGALSHFALYTAELTESQILDHYTAGLHAFGHPYSETSGDRIDRVLDEMGWPSGDRSISTGTVPQWQYRPEGKRPLDHIREIEASEQGLFFLNVDGDATFRDRQWLWNDADTGVTFTDDGNASDVEYTGLVRDGNHVDTVRNVVTFSYKDVGGITRRDLTSITDYGATAESVTSPTLPSGQAASLMAAYLLRAKKDPETRISSLVAPLRISGGDNNAEDIFERELGDVVTVERTPVGSGGQRTYKVQVLGINYHIGRNQGFARFYLSPGVESTEDASYLVCGTGDTSDIGVTAGNIIPG